MTTSDVKKEDPGATNQRPDYSLLDMRKKDENVWFTRIPDYFYEDWKKITKKTQIGTVTITPSPEGNNQLTVHFYESAISSFPFRLIPEYQLDLNENIDKNKYIFTHKKDTGSVRILGRVQSEATLRTDVNSHNEISSYLDRRVRAEKKGKKKFLKDTPPPETRTRPSLMSGGLRSEKKEVKDKRIKKTKEMIKKDILSLFQNRENWKMQEIVAAVEQEQKLIVPILSQIAEYNQNEKTYSLKKDLL